MSRRKLALRWILLLALGGLLLAAQQQALLHPLAHLPGSPQAQSDDAAAHETAAAVCACCLACAVAAHLAAASTPGSLVPPDVADLAAACDAPAGAARAPSQWHNRGPPVSA